MSAGNPRAYRIEREQATVPIMVSARQVDWCWPDADQRAQSQAERTDAERLGPGDQHRALELVTFGACRATDTRVTSLSWRGIQRWQA